MYGRNSNIIQFVVVVMQLGDNSTSGSGKGGTIFMIYIYIMIVGYKYYLCHLSA